MHRRGFLFMMAAGMTEARLRAHAGGQDVETDPLAPPAVFATRTALVVLTATVTDRRGRYVSGLPASAFAVYEDGQLQQIEFFGTQDAAVTAGLLIDGSGSMAAGWSHVAAAGAAFVETSRAQDEVFALVFNERVRAVLPPEAPFTRDAATMRGALMNVSARGRTAFHDAMVAGLEHVDVGSHLRRALVVVGDGGDNASAASFDDVRRGAERSNTAIYTIAVVDPLDRDAHPRRLRQLAALTGGSAFQPDRIADVARVMRDIARDIRESYTIGYMPADLTRGGLRQLRVVVTAPGQGTLTVRSRPGYALDGR